jgi:endonuclease-8
MPEGHTLHRLARDHQKWFAGQKLIVCSPQGRFAEEADQLSGMKLQRVSAHGKHLFYHWPGSLITHIHLGLYGKFRLHQNPPPDPRGAVRVRVVGTERSFDLNGPTCCELIDVGELTAIKQRLGEDPLLPDAAPETVWASLQRRRSPIGAVLLNQSVIAGLGNIFRAEILFLAGINPEKPANEVSRTEFEDIWRLSVDFLKTGVKYNRIITTHIGQSIKGLSKLKAAERLNIYKKSNCPKCDGKISVSELGNRKLYYCSRCQTG